MGIDRDLRDLVVGELVGPLHLQRHSARLDLEARGQRGRNEARCDFLVYLGDALPEQVFDQVEDGTAMPLQQPSDRGKLCIDVDLGKANREIAVFGVANTIISIASMSKRTPVANATRSLIDMTSWT